MRSSYLGSVLFLVQAAAALGQDALKADPAHYRLVSENSLVRVLHVTIGPHERTRPNTSPPSVVVFLGDTYSRAAYPGGRVEPPHRHKKGDVITRETPLEFSSIENLSDRPYDVLRIELKTGGTGPSAAADSARASSSVGARDSTGAADSTRAGASGGSTR